MNVSQLVQKLLTLPQDAVVLIASDEEGNSIHDLFEIADGPAFYDEDERTWETIHPDDLDEYDPESLTSAVTLWP